MRRRTTRSYLLGVSLLLCSVLGLLLSACGGGNSSSNEKVTLNFVSWIGGDQRSVYTDEINRFHKAYPNITVNYEVLPPDQLGAQVKARFNSGDAPDVMALFAGSFKDQFVDAGDLMDLSNESWVSKLTSSAKPSALSANGKQTVVEPISQGAVGVIYNKQLFAQQGIAIPSTYAEFLAACDKLKAAGIAPLSVGTKDAFPASYPPLAMALQSVYAPTPSFPTDIASGKTTYANSNWVQVLQDTSALNTAGYFEKNNVGTSYQDSMDLVASGKAAMTIDGEFGVATIKKTNPSVDLGMFPLPYGQSSTRIVPTYIDVTLAIAKSTKHADAARKFLAYFSDPKNGAQYLTDTGTFSTFNGVTPKLDPALQQFQPYIQSASEDLGAQVNMPTNTLLALEKGIQSMFAGSETPQQVAQDMDKATKS